MFNDCIFMCSENASHYFTFIPMGKSVFHYASSSGTHPCDSARASSIHSMSKVLVARVNDVYIEYNIGVQYPLWLGKLDAGIWSTVHHFLFHI